ncbi:PREDICTED: sulfated surface glycoprotein 185-like [Trachymyrmex septentrionalis]|uniref:sulfated surface glycoprotein 185-like n=1 Tax=Trachymyrmex septentrionalis TaxID=34720 RepID=UPI00084ED38B|nr:PREDICTED: sulfated surface glycoprotein 185-like [Trachymyrmex septentrionalis]
MAYREAWRLLDEKFRRYLGGSREQSRPAEDHLPSPPPSSPPAPPAIPNQLEVIPPPQRPSPQPHSPSPQPPSSPPQTPSPPLQTFSPPPRSPSPVFSDSLTERIFPDTPPLSPDSSIDPIPQKNSVPDKLYGQRGVLRGYSSTPTYIIFLNPRVTLSSQSSLISQFPRTTTASISQGAYTIGPYYFDPEKIRNAITGQNSTSCIPVFLPNSANPFLVPVEFFYNLFLLPPFPSTK